MSIAATDTRASTETIIAALESYGFPRPEVEYQFHPERKWLFDFAWPTARVALEKEGGVFRFGPECPCCHQRRVGAHSSITGLKRDIEKYNEAAVLDWIVIRATPDQILSRELLLQLRTVLEMRDVRINRNAINKLK